MMKRDKEEAMKKSPWPAAIITFFAVVFAVNFGFLYLAIATDDGLTDPDYYRKGLFYDRELRAERALGWQVGLTVEPAPGSVLKNRVRVEVTKKDGAPLEGAEVKVVFRRPATDDYDREFGLAPAGPAYSAEVTVPLEGYWDVVVVAGKDGHTMDRVFRIKV